MTINDLTSMIVAFATVGSLLYISRQVNVTRQQTKGQFLLALDAQFEKSMGIMPRLLEPTFVPVDSEWIDIWRFMGVFERISVMVDDKILDAALVDRLYGPQLMTLIANDVIYQRLAASAAEWQDFIDSKTGTYLAACSGKHMSFFPYRYLAACCGVVHYAIADRRQQSAKIVSRNAQFVERVHKLNKNVYNTTSRTGF